LRLTVVYCRILLASNGVSDSSLSLSLYRKKKKRRRYRLFDIKEEAGEEKFINENDAN